MPSISAAPPTRRTCDFCGEEHLVKFLGKVGGMRSQICGKCVLAFADVIFSAAWAFEGNSAGSPQR